MSPAGRPARFPRKPVNRPTAITVGAIAVGAITIAAGASWPLAAAAQTVRATVSSPVVIAINDHVVGFYFGRDRTGPSGLEGANWVDPGAWNLGIVNYAVYAGDEAILYDASTLPGTGRWEREYLERELGIENFRVVLSHWHLDHIAGLPAFADSPIYAYERTSASLSENKEAIEAGTLWGPPAIGIVLPTNVADGALDLEVGAITVQFRHFDIHSPDSFVMVIPADRTLYAGDTLEDTVTYISEPGDLPRHLDELERMRGLPIDRIYPNHGNPDVIANGGYTKALVDAVAEYDRNMLMRVRDEAYLDLPIEAMLPRALAAGVVSVWPSYRDIHRGNLELVQDYWQGRTSPPLPAD